MKVADIMRSPVVTVSKSATIRDAACLMQKHNIGFLVVIDETGRMCGVISERDIVDAIARGLSVTDTVDKIMKTSVITVHPDDTVWRAARLMLEHGIRHLVVTKNSHVVGVVSIRDLIRLEGFLKLMAELDEYENKPDFIPGCRICGEARAN